MAKKVYPEMNTLVRVFENTLLSDAQKNELAGAYDISAVKKSLISLGFFRYASPEPDDDFAAALDIERKGWLDWCESITPDRSISDIFRLEDKLHGLRVYLKERLLQKDMSYLYDTDSKYNKEYFDGICSEKQAHDIYAELIQACENDYAVHSSFARTELIIRFFSHREKLRMAEKIEDDKTVKLIKAETDSDIISVILQGRKTGLKLNSSLLKCLSDSKPALDVERLLSCKDEELDAYFAKSEYAPLWALLNKNGSLKLFDVLIDNYLLSLCSSAKLDSFGKFPLVAFMYAKLLDIKSVKVIILLKKAGASEDEVSERMRDSYEL